jgi:hypothetical protein
MNGISNAEMLAACGISQQQTPNVKYKVNIISTHSVTIQLLTDVLNNTHSGKRAAQSSNILS